MITRIDLLFGSVLGLLEQQRHRRVAMKMKTVRYTDVGKVQQLWSKWEIQGLYIFFFPKYCSEMNPIELEWQYIKKNELAGKMFEDELELAYAVIHGVEVRAERGKYTTERVKFNSN